VSPVAQRFAEAVEPLRSDPSRSAVLLDIDGTLAPIVRHADDAHVPEATRTVLIEVAKRYGLVGCVSGRRAAEARRIVAIGSIGYVGNHGAEVLRPGAASPEIDPRIAGEGERVRKFAGRVYTSEHQHLRIRTEDKDAIAAFHWRGAPDEEAAQAAAREIAAKAEGEGFAVKWGRKVLEVRPPGAFDKGVGIAALLDGRNPGHTATAKMLDGSDPGQTAGHTPLDGDRPGQTAGHTFLDGDRPGHAGTRKIEAAMYVGDDATDRDAFRALREMVSRGRLDCAVCVAVRSEEAPEELIEEADLTIDGPEATRELLRALL
jgi:trehalose 6-phosphate phosphatase